MGLFMKKLYKLFCMISCLSILILSWCSTEEKDITYDENGVKKSEWFLKDWLPHGDRTFYHENWKIA